MPNGTGEGSRRIKKQAVQVYTRRIFPETGLNWMYVSPTLTEQDYHSADSMLRSNEVQRQQINNNSYLHLLLRRSLTARLQTANSGLLLIVFHR